MKKKKEKYEERAESAARDWSMPSSAFFRVDDKRKK